MGFEATTNEAPQKLKELVESYFLIKDQDDELKDSKVKISRLQEDAFSIGKVVDYAISKLVKVVMEKVLEVIKFLMVMAMCNTITPCKRWGYFKLLIFLF